MPFTISHAAAVLPFSKLGKSGLPLAAMMIGSMSPDFAYFLPESLAQTSRHDLEGILFFCWPASLVLWLLFVHVIEGPTIELLPAAWRARVPRSDTTVSLKALALASIAVVLGAMTHVAWDAFTHANTPMTEVFPALRAEVFTVRGRSIRVYLVLQYVSSVVGLLALALWALKLRRAAPQVRSIHESGSDLSDRTRIGAALFVIAASGATAMFSYSTNPASRFEDRIFHLLIGGMTGWALAWCVVALFVNLRSRAAARG